MSSHRCPKRGCQKVVMDHLFACGRHWFSLSAGVRADIYRTAHLPLNNPVRWAIVQEARVEWGDITHQESKGRDVQDDSGRPEGEGAGD